MRSWKYPSFYRLLPRFPDFPAGELGWLPGNERSRFLLIIATIPVDFPAGGLGSLLGNEISQFLLIFTSVPGFQGEDFVPERNPGLFSASPTPGSASRREFWKRRLRRRWKRAGKASSPRRDPLNARIPFNPGWLRECGLGKIRNAQREL